MSPELRAVIRELEQQRNDLLAGMGMAQAFEKMASRAAEAVHAAEVAKVRAVAAEAEVAALATPPEPPAGD